MPQAVQCRANEFIREGFHGHAGLIRFRREGPNSVSLRAIKAGESSFL